MSAPLKSIAVSVFLLAHTIAQAQKPVTDNLTPQAFSTAADAAKYTLLDVRTPEEWKAGHLKDAVHIDWYADDFAARVSKLDKSKPVLVYCAAGGRSAEAQEAMRDLGFKHVVNLKGGYSAWTAAGLPVVK